MGRDVVLVSSADETAFEVRALLEDDRARAGARPGKGDAPLPLLGRRRLVPPSSGAGCSGPSSTTVEAVTWD